MNFSCSKWQHHHRQYNVYSRLICHLGRRNAETKITWSCKWWQYVRGIVMRFSFRVTNKIDCTLCNLIMEKPLDHKVSCCSSKSHTAKWFLTRRHIYQCQRLYEISHSITLVCMFYPFCDMTFFLSLSFPFSLSPVCSVFEQYAASFTATDCVLRIENRLQYHTHIWHSATCIRDDFQHCSNNFDIKQTFATRKSGTECKHTRRHCMHRASFLIEIRKKINS